MNEKQKLGQESAFPTDVRDSGVLFNTEDRGMSKRFYAACAAMQGFLSNPTIIPSDKLAEYSFKYADELLKQENE